MKTVRVVLHDVIAVIEGRTMTVTDDEGEECRLRLFTAEEFLAHQHAAVDKVRPGAEHAKITLDRARDIVQPIRIQAAESVRAS